MATVLASDDIGKIYGTFDEDLVDELRDLAVKCRLAAPSAEDASSAAAGARGGKRLAILAVECRYLLPAHEPRKPGRRPGLQWTIPAILLGLLIGLLFLKGFFRGRELAAREDTRRMVRAAGNAR